MLKADRPLALTADTETAISEAAITRFTTLAIRGRIGAVGQLSVLAELLRLPEFSLQWLGVGRARQGVWSFPEHDGRRRVVGITERHNDGTKKALAGSRRGLTLPVELLEGCAAIPSGPLYIAEGATDTAALLTTGCLAIGRPAAVPSANVLAFLVEFLTNNPALLADREVVVVGDNDSHGTGIKGALTTKASLEANIGRPVHAVRPPDQYKDVRDQVTAGAWSAGLIPLEPATAATATSTTTNARSAP
jgi:phage/plasmid primase-like uncharacterized protein